MKNGHEESEVLSAYADGAATGEESSRVKAHVASCRGCAELLASFQETRAALAAAPRRFMPRELRGRIERRFAPVPWTARWAAFLKRPLVWVPAGALAVGAAALFLLEPAAPDNVSLEVLMASHARYQGESLAPQADLHHAYFTAHVAEEISNNVE